MLVRFEKLNKVAILDSVWIGIRDIIISGVYIRKVAIIGTGSVVTKDVPDYSIGAGYTARLITLRK